MAGTPESHNVALGRAIQRLRKDSKLTQQQLADRARLSVRELREIERGTVSADWGTVRYLAYGMDRKLAEVFRLLVEDLERSS
jgi:transcriptional regulator with XRE-family HTH domain